MKTQTIGSILVIVGVVVALVSAYPLAFAGTTASGARFTESWAADATCGYGGVTVLDECWAANRTLALNGPAMTATVSLGVAHASVNVYPTDIAATVTVLNNGPAVYNSLGTEVPQPVYGQFTFIDCIVQSSGVCMPIVNVNSLNQQLTSYRDFADNGFLANGGQFMVGTLLSGASDTMKLDFQLRETAFSQTTVVAGQEYHIRGFVGQHSFDWTIYITATLN